MNEIQYRYTYTLVKVFLNKKLIGSIRTVQGGFQYYPKGVKEPEQAGDIYPTLQECKNSLEGE